MKRRKSIPGWARIAAMALVLMIYPAANMLIDPFGVFGDPIFDWYSYNEYNNPRAAKIAWLEENHERFDSYVIGSSCAASLSTGELNEYMEDQYTAAARQEVESYIKGLLASAGIEAKKIRADIHITEDISISCTKASLTFAFDSEARRARALLESVLEGVPLEVTVDGA